MDTKTEQMALFEPENIMGRVSEVARMPKNASESTEQAQAPDLDYKSKMGKPGVLANDEATI